MYEELISENIIKKGLKEYCEDRFNKLHDPCGTCIYRDRFSNPDRQSCIFDNCPRDWYIPIKN